MGKRAEGLCSAGMKLAPMSSSAMVMFWVNSGEVNNRGLKMWGSQAPRLSVEMKYRQVWNIDDKRNKQNREKDSTKVGRFVRAPHEAKNAWPSEPPMDWGELKNTAPANLWIHFRFRIRKHCNYQLNRR